MTSEIKSGYGLTVEDELKMLEVVGDLSREGWDLEATLLGAHTVPRDRNRAEYLADVTGRMIPQAANEGLARFVDVFVEKGAYTIEEARAVFEAGKKHGLVPRVHADQITAGGGAELAAEVGAASADHLENISDAGAAAMAEAGVVAVLLPGGDALSGRRGTEAGGGGCSMRASRVAVATDANPGSSPTNNLALMATMACTMMGLTAEEAVRAVTRGAAKVLRRNDVGTLDVGARANLIVLNHGDARALAASFGEPVVSKVVVAARSEDRG